MSQGPGPTSSRGYARVARSPENRSGLHLGDRNGACSSPGQNAAPEVDARYLAVALGLVAIFMVGEVVAAALSGSLALLADAGHMLTDLGALGTSLWAARLATRPARGIWTFGLKRAEILSAAASGVTLVVVAAVITVEAANRLVSPPRVHGAVVLGVALAGAVVNLAITVVLARADRSSLNVRGVFAHTVTDLYAFAGTAAAGLVIVLTGWARADGIASLVVAALMARASWRLLRDSGRVLLQGCPENVSLDDVRAHITAVDHVLSVHDLHAWALTPSLPSLSAHVVVEDHCFASGHAPQILDSLQACLGEHFDLAHSTFQLEPFSHSAHEHDTHN
ncbi:MAG TPA: cation diffusion facilitator family transporter [Acidimicrobiales bacterium]|nr:cation diffusion facilitator family transporter [Acidimicrobiales bacterium]